MGDMRNTILAGRTPRSIALFVLIAVFVGNLFFESCELLGMWMGLSSQHANECILIVGILGVIGFGVSLLGRRSVGDNTTVD